MNLKVIIEDKAYQINIPDNMLEEAEDFFRKMDHDMDQGWQMSRVFIENPDRTERCQIAADKLLTAMEAENETLANLMAAYILKRMPDVKTVYIDAAGEMQNTEFNNSLVDL